MFIFIFSYFEVLNNADIKITTLIIMTALTGLGMLLAYPTITISAQENMTNTDQNMTNTDQNMTNTDQNMTNTDQNMTELGFGTISGGGRGTG
jgi:hypothetical protein